MLNISMKSSRDLGMSKEAYVRVTSRNRTLAHIRCFEKIADEVDATEMSLLVYLRAIRHPFGWKT